MCRFLPIGELKAKIEEIISFGIINGNLEVLGLIGMNSEKVYPLL